MDNINDNLQTKIQENEKDSMEFEDFGCPNIEDLLTVKLEVEDKEIEEDPSTDNTSDVTTFDISSICRVCAEPCSESLPLEPYIAVKLTEFLDIRVYEGDGLPHQMCQSCVCELQRWTSFRSKIDQAQEYLRQQITLLRSQQQTSSGDGESSKIEISREPVKKFGCKFCNFTTENSIESKTHNLTHNTPINDNNKIFEPKRPISPNHPYKCGSCTFQSKSTNKFRSHVDKHTKTTRSIPCAHCNVYFRNMDFLVKHLEEHVKDPTKIISFDCNICDKAFSVAEKLRVHKLSHSQFKPFMCAYCEATFTCKSRLKREHMPKHHPNEPWTYIENKEGEMTTSQRIPPPPQAVPNVSVPQNSTIQPVQYMYQLPYQGAIQNSANFVFNIPNISQVDPNLPIIVSHSSPVSSQPQTIILPCDICKAAFSDIKSFKEHVRTELTKANEIRCGLCGNMFNKVEILTKHIVKHKNLQHPVQCEACSKYFKDIYSLEQHLKIHSLEKCFQCKFCELSFKYRESWRIHFLNIHQEIKLEEGNEGYRVDLDTAEKSKARASVRKKEKKSEPHYECTICKIRYIEKDEITKHFIETHIKNESICEFCTFSTTNYDDLIDHIKTHIEWKLFCILCNKSFKTESGKRDHMKNHSDEKLYQCEFCGKSFKHRTVLYRHKKYVHSSKDFFLSCSHCSKSFPTKTTLQLHMYGHTGDYPVHCKLCGKGFIASHYLKRHMITHTDMKPFECSKCSKGFRSKYTCNLHEEKCKPDVS